MKIKAALYALHMTQKQLALRLNVSTPVVSNWIRGITPVPEDALEQIEEILNLPTPRKEHNREVFEGFLGREEQHTPAIKPIGLYGVGPCGKLNFAETEVQSWINPGDIHSPSNCFALTAFGDSMEPVVSDKDLLVFRRIDGVVLEPKGEHPSLPNRLAEFHKKIVVATVDNETTVKRLVLDRSSTEHWHLQLQPENRAFDTIVVRADQQFTLNGVLVRLIRDL